MLTLVRALRIKIQRKFCSIADMRRKKEEHAVVQPILVYFANASQSPDPPKFYHLEVDIGPVTLEMLSSAMVCNVVLV